MSPLNVAVASSRYQAMIGVGGIGAGRFFVLNGNHTLGREESRSGRFLDRRDYCKLHIISHYVQALLGPEFTTIPIGKVGDDDVGTRLLEEMKEIGLDVRHVGFSCGDPTLFSFCFVYPDGSGGNLTTDDSACSRVDAALVAEAEPEFARFDGCGIALAVPEVPMAAREKILGLGSQYGFLRVASFAVEELVGAMNGDVLHRVDLLALNLDEAAAAGEISRGAHASSIVESAVTRLGEINPGMLIAITGGQSGSWSWDGTALVQHPAIKTQVVSTAGAGDAYLAGTAVGLVAGLPMVQAQELAMLTAALSVTSPHTINKEIDGSSLGAFATRVQFPTSELVQDLLKV
ncbi:MAG: carbohydrate kinase family protein [Ardenticatenia bacterium]|nr:carbohydrate kinase family protein [Ardenticatenia bacterium]